MVILSMRKLVSALLVFCLFISSEIKAQSNGIDTTYATKGLATITPSYLKESGGSTPSIAFVDSLNRTIIIGQKYSPALAIYATRILANGAIDSSYGTNGTIFIPLPLSDLNEYKIRRVQADGKLILAGYDTISPSFGYDFVVRRYLTNGKVDTSFGINGYRSYAISLFDDIPSDLVIAPDGKIILAGTKQPNTGYQRAVMLKLLPNGNLDTSFNHTGLLVHTVLEQGTKLMLQPDGKIILAGQIFVFGWDYDIYVARFLSNGTTDTSFSLGNGFFIGSNLYMQNDYVYDLQLLPNGGIGVLVNGNSICLLNSDGTRNFAFSNGTQYRTPVPLCTQFIPTPSLGFYTQYNSKVRKFLANGNIDSSFASNGIYDFAQSSGGDSSVYLVQLNNQNLLCLGQKANKGLVKTLVSSITSAGEVWQGFGQNGSMAILHTTYESVALSIAVLGQKAVENGNVFVSFSCTLDSVFYFGMLKVNSLGLQDLSFAGKGVFLNPLQTGAFPNQFSTDFSFTPAGKILATTVTQTSSTNSKISLFKFSQTGSIDTSFGINGFVNDSTTYAVGKSKIGFQSNGSILVAGGKSIYRYTANGVRDLGFSAAPISINDLLVTYTDQILISSDTMVQRLNSNGSLDLLFAGNGRYVSYVTYIPGYKIPPTREYARFFKLSFEPGSKSILVASTLNYSGYTSFHGVNWIRLSEHGYIVSTPNPFYSKTGPSSFYPQIHVGQIPFDDGSYLVSATYLKDVINANYFLARVLTNGTLDANFGTNGSLNLGIASSPIAYLETCPISGYQSYALSFAGNVLKIWRIQSTPSYVLDFAASKTTIGFKDSVAFSPFFGGPATSYEWKFIPNSVTFLNGTNANSQYPILQFNKETSYHVSLKVGYNNTFLSAVKSNYINLVTTLNFVANKTTVLLTDSVLFTPSFSDAVKQYQWIIPTPNKQYLAGTDSSSKEPLIRFTKPGFYDVTLKVFYADTFQSHTKTAYIKLFPEVDFVANTTTGFAHDTLTLNLVSTETFSSYQWTITPDKVIYFSGTNANSRNPIFKLTQANFYDVQLVLGYLGDSFSISKPAYFTINNRTGIQEQAAAGILVYPNPSQSQVTIQLGSNQTQATAYLYNTQGLLQAEYNLEEANTSIPLPEATGIYFLRIKTDTDKIYSIKLVKE
ncbi:MAG: hypothetical protein CFE21_16200 [Bacteroidetes bacterium B1(2017)]|nr:MAG: hypothetical protein CFE21_16200 [Bacteroidetes bacterium B1(2017)]